MLYYDTVHTHYIIKEYIRIIEIEYASYILYYVEEWQSNTEQ